MKLSDKLEKLMTDVNDIKIEQARQGTILERNTKDVEHHIKRSDNLEDQVELLRMEVTNNKTKASAIWQVLTIISSSIVALASLAISYFKS